MSSFKQSIFLKSCLKNFVILTFAIKRHALNVLKDDLIVRLDQFSSEMLILREEIKSLQTVKAALQLRINELEEEQRKNKEELAAKNKKLEEEDVS